MQQGQRWHGVPTEAALNRRDREWFQAQYSEMRIRAYNINGERIGVAGVGEGDQRLTFPAKLRVETVLGFNHWIKEAPPGSQKWYVQMGDWRPKAVIFEDGRMAVPWDPIGMKGETVTIVDTEITNVVDEDREMPSLEGIRTPRTPSVGGSVRSGGSPIRIYEREIEIRTPSDEDTASEMSLEGTGEEGERPPVSASRRSVPRSRSASNSGVPNTSDGNPSQPTPSLTEAAEETGSAGEDTRTSAMAAPDPRAPTTLTEAAHGDASMMPSNRL